VWSLARGPVILYSMAESLEQQLRQRLAQSGQQPPWVGQKIQRAPQPKPTIPARKRYEHASPTKRKPKAIKAAKSVGPMTEEEQAAICAFILDGNSAAKASQMFGRSPASISKALRTQNVVSMHPTPEAAHAALADYSTARRRILFNKIFDRVERIIDDEEPDAKDMKDLAIAVGITVDKRRLDDGEATQRSEKGEIGEAREKLQGKLEGIIRNRSASEATTYVAVEDEGDMPGELYEVEQEAVYEDEDADSDIARPSTWGVVGE
jgi:hypothetical protein